MLDHSNAWGDDVTIVRQNAIKTQETSCVCIRVEKRNLYEICSVNNENVLGYGIWKQKEIEYEFCCYVRLCAVMNLETSVIENVLVHTRTHAHKQAAWTSTALIDFAIHWCELTEGFCCNDTVFFGAFVMSL